MIQPRIDLPVRTGVPTFCRYRYGTGTERYAQCKRGDVASIFLPVRGEVPSPRAGEKSPASVGCDSARATRGRRLGAGDLRAATVEVLFLLLFFSSSSSSLFLRSPISFNRPPMVDFSLNRPPMADFLRYRPVAGGPRNGKLTDRYVPPVLDGTA
ncbi:hypothetical protein BHM03_00057665 [Ensete ventricosum]|nr:hypothetical protein BHM03_00057665 [Ensete ventricosum]